MSMLRPGEALRMFPCCDHCPKPASIGWPGHTTECPMCQKEALLQTPPRPATVEPNNDPEEDSMTRFINRTEVKPGDTIRVTREFHVTDVKAYGLGERTSISHDGPGSGRVYLVDQSQIELVKRPIDLPTEFGSFVEVTIAKYASTKYGKGHWILTELAGEKLWVSATRVEKTPEEFAEFLGIHGVSFRVVS